jgi:teichoic acid transport system permease protein
MISTLSELIRSVWNWRWQIFHLAVIDLIKQYRGAALGWFWLVVKPLIYILVFSLGMRGARVVSSDAPFILWLCSGMLAWFFLSSIFGSGANVFARNASLAKHGQVPMVILPVLAAMSDFIVLVCSYAVMLLILPLFGIFPEIYWLQIPLLMVMAFAFVVFFSLFVSCFSALSKDFSKLIKTMSLPFFWMSGVMFEIQGESALYEWVSAFNPISFFMVAFRGAICNHQWFWSNPMILWPFLGELVLFIIVSCHNYKYLKPEVCDAI